MDSGADSTIEDKFGETAFSKISGKIKSDKYNTKLEAIKKLLTPTPAASSSSSRQRTTRRKQARLLKRRKTRRMSSQI